jgi:HD-GYP domain-containing protein (c-di-GMP phosphodiesterase class II)
MEELGPAQIKKEEGSTRVPFFRISAPLLLRTDPLVSDVYIRLSELKFVKLFHRGDQFTEEDHAKYHERKGISHFYARKDDAEHICSKVTEKLEGLLTAGQTDRETVAAASVEALISTQEIINQVGMTPEVQRMVRTNMDLVLKEMQESPAFSTIMKSMVLDKGKYIAAHSHILSEVSCALAAIAGWSSDTSFKKLIMASFLHDMGMSDNRLCRVKNLQELSQRIGEFGPHAVEEYRSHPKRAAVLIQGMREVPADVDKIILQHHELPIGTGFPNQLTHVHIHPLASVLIVAHDLVDWMLDHPGSFEIKDFIDSKEESYRAGNFRKVLSAVRRLTFD